MWNFRVEEYRKKAILEDFLVDILYSEYSRKLTMHGGTAVWRCYGGERFSRDIDIYFKTDSIEDFCKSLLDFLKQKGLAIKERGYFNQINTFSVTVQTDTKVKLDINFDYAQGDEVDYLTVSGGKRLIIALTPEALLNEKINAYADKIKNKKEEVQDLYDMWVLRNSIPNPLKKTRERLNALLSEIKNKKPVNVYMLELLMLDGLTPSFEKMIGDLNEWMK